MSEEHEVWTLEIDYNHGDHEIGFMTVDKAWARFQEIEWRKHLVEDGEEKVFDRLDDRPGFHIERQFLDLTIYPDAKGTFICLLGYYKPIKILPFIELARPQQPIEKNNLEFDLLKELFFSMFDPDLANDDSKVFALLAAE